MKVSPANSMLVIGAFACFAEAIYAPTHHDPGALLTAVLGILMLPRALLLSTPLPVAFSGCFLAAIAVAGDHGLVDINKPLWIALFMVGFGCFGFWERIEKLWKRENL